MLEQNTINHTNMPVPVTSVTITISGTVIKKLHEAFEQGKITYLDLSDKTAHVRK
jgi:hypothetical protein